MKRVINQHIVDNLARLVDTIYAVRKTYTTGTASKPALTDWSLNLRDRPALTCEFFGSYLIHTPAPPLRPQVAVVGAHLQGLLWRQLSPGPVDRSLFRVCTGCFAAPKDTTKKVGPRAERQLQCSGASPTERTRPTHEHARREQRRDASARPALPELRAAVRPHRHARGRLRGAPSVLLPPAAHLRGALLANRRDRLTYSVSPSPKSAGAQIGRDARSRRLISHITTTCKPVPPNIKTSETACSSPLQPGAGSANDATNTTPASSTPTAESDMHSSRSSCSQGRLERLNPATYSTRAWSTYAVRASRPAPAGAAATRCDWAVSRLSRRARGRKLSAPSSTPTSAATAVTKSTPMPAQRSHPHRQDQEHA